MTLLAIALALMHTYMKQWLELNPEEEQFFLTKSLDIIILTFWPAFVVIAVIIEIFGPVKE
jgi:hypothetical protein